MRRRQFLGLLGAAAGTVALAGCDTPGQTGEMVRSEVPIPEPFRVPLPVPPVKRPVRRDATTDWYEIVQRPAEVEILPGVRTQILGYDGVFPGPTIESRSGRRTVVRHHNRTDVPTVVHLHGGHTPADHDGWPTDLVMPLGGAHQHQSHHPGKITQGKRDYVYPLDQPAATLWYHDHRMDFTGPQVYRGLAGFHLVRDAVEDALPLPAGDREIPLMIADRTFAADGSLSYPAADHAGHTAGTMHDWVEGVLGDVILVNGAPWPELEVVGARYRFRVLNASNARRYRLTLDPPPPEGPQFVQIGSDAGLLAAPVEHGNIDIAPAERFDLVVDFSSYRPGQVVTLRNAFGTGDTRQVMRFRVTDRARDESAVPARLAEVTPLVPPEDAPRREFAFTRGVVGDRPGWVINGKPFDPERVDATPRLGDIEIWTFFTDLHHPIHVHLSPFQVLSRNGRSPGDLDGGWKDTVDLRPAEAVEVAIRFTGYRGRFLLHCHNLEHEDIAMMSTFETK
ncbi:multicopper oxidase family protein [Cryptosporangium aurantiacum]|uniref:Spore coat protein A n=1 Tax=Cryptosporangium aurantiacum TaxID=134849 RepID=A0A1M7NQT5_9ACTN|nr:multicopper oxidase family protein [Cryptosporangium aurantiacum]SHN05777.1 spore coat protein A [Cryptosporangium aurantiacum]